MPKSTTLDHPGGGAEHDERRPAPDTRPAGPRARSTAQPPPGAATQATDPAPASSAGPKSEQVLFSDDGADREVPTQSGQNLGAPAPEQSTTFVSADSRVTQPTGLPSWGNTTLRSASRPQTPPSSSWDERRIVSLEKEIDQLRATRTLLVKRLDRLEVQSRVALGVAVCALAAAIAAHWV